MPAFMVAKTRARGYRAYQTAAQTQGIRDHNLGDIAQETDVIVDAFF